MSQGTTEHQGMARADAGTGDDEKDRDRLSPTWPERMRLIRAFQAKALAQADPRTATVEVLSGDLVLFAYRIQESMEKSLTDGPVTPESSRRFEQQAEMYLKFVRQFDRLTQIGRLLSLPPKGEAHGV